VLRKGQDHKTAVAVGRYRAIPVVKKHMGKALQYSQGNADPRNGLTPWMPKPLGKWLKLQMLSNP
jgi:hypothetical protein